MAKLLSFFQLAFALFIFFLAIRINTAKSNKATWRVCIEIINITTPVYI